MSNYLPIQLAHIETYGIQPGKRENKETGTIEFTKRSQKEVLNEAARVVGSAPHIPVPAAPTILYGQSPVELAKNIEDDFCNARDRRGHRLHGNTQVLMGCIASYPIPIGEMMDTAGAEEIYFRWEEKVIRFYQDRWGNNLRSVIRHPDESYLHLHIYLSPNFWAGETNLHAIHPAMKAAAAAAPKNDRTGRAMKRRRHAEKMALRKFQDDYFEAVSVHFGHARLGPQRERLSQRDMQRERGRERAAVIAEDVAERRLRAADEQIAREFFEFDEKKRREYEKLDAARAEIESLCEELRSAVKQVGELLLPVPRNVVDALDDADAFIKLDSTSKF